MAAPKSDLDKLNSLWTTRVQGARAKGMNMGVLKSIYDHDVQRLGQGHAPMTHNEAFMAYQAAASGGKPVLGQHPHGLDLRGDITGLVRGLYHAPGRVIKDIQAIPQYPKELSQILSGKKQLGETHIGEIAPLATALIPGVGPEISAGILAAEEGQRLSTKAGRQEAARHPISAALQFLPGANEAAGLVGKVAPSTALGRLTTESELAGTSVLRQGLEHAKNLPIKHDIAGQPQTINTFLERGKIGSPRLRSAVSQFNQEQLLAAQEAQTFAKQIDHITKKASDLVQGDTPLARRQELTRQMQRWNVNEPHDPRLQEVYNTYRQYNEKFGTTLSEQGHLTWVPRTPGGDVGDWYRSGGKVGRAFQNHQGAESRLASTIQDYHKQQNMLDITTRNQAKLFINGKPPSWDDLASRVPIKDFFQVDRNNPLYRLAGSDGPILKLHQALNDGQEKSALHQISNLLKRQYLPDHIRQGLESIRSDTRGMTKRVSEWDRLNTLKEQRQSRFKSTIAKVTKTQADTNKAFTRLVSRLREEPPARFEPKVNDAIHERLSSLLQSKKLGTPENLHKLDLNLYSSLFDKKEIETVRSEVMSTWQDMEKQGFQPLFIHSIAPTDLSRLEHPHFPAAGKTPLTQVKDRTFTFTPYVQDVGVGLTSAAAEHILRDHGVRFADWLDQGYGRTLGDIRSEILNTPQGKTLSRSQLDGYIQSHYTQFDPETITMGSRKILPSLNEESTRLIPRSIAETLNNAAPKDGTWLSNMWNRGLNLHYASIFFMSPRHMAHIFFSNGWMLAGRAEKELFAHPMQYLSQAYRTIKEGEVPPQLMHQLSIMDPASVGFDVAATRGQIRMVSEAMGKRLGPLKSASDGVMRANNWWRGIEEHVSDMYRTMDFLSAKKAGLKRGLSEEDALHAGLEHAAKTFANWNDRLPYERAMIRSVFPFYGWTKHVLKYAMSYPIDHPLRAAIITNFSANEVRDWKSGFPSQWASLFHLGKPDARGNITAVDIRSTNPFRDVASYVTLAGLSRSLNPVMEAFLDSVGVNPMTASVGLHPELSINPDTGGLQGSSRTSFVKGLLPAFVPEAQLLTDAIGWTDRVKYAKQTNPSLYRKLIFDKLNIPWAPVTTNLPQEYTKLEANRDRVASQNVSHSLRTGDFSSLDQYDRVPFQGQLVDPRKLAQLWQTLRKRQPHIPVSEVWPHQPPQGWAKYLR